MGYVYVSFIILYPFAPPWHGSWLWAGNDTPDTMGYFLSDGMNDWIESDIDGRLQWPISI